MHTKSNPIGTAGQPPLDLVLDRLPNGELAWLRPDVAPEDDDPRYVLTQRGRDELVHARAMQALFGPSATVAASHARGRVTP